MMFSRMLSRFAPYAAPRLYDLLAYRVVLAWLGMGGQEQRDWVATTLRHDGRVLEAPIGTAALTAPIYAERPALTVIGLDYSLPMLKAAQARLAEAGIVNVHLVCADMALLPFAADQFEQLVSLNGLHVLPRYEPAIDEMLRVAHDGATIVGTAGALSDDPPRRWLQGLLDRLGYSSPVDSEQLHELLGMTWSRLSGQRTGAIYAFRRFALDRATGEPLPRE